MSILVIAEIDGQKLGAATLNTVAAAKQIGSDIDLLVAGKGIADAANAGAKLDGVKKVLKADAAHLDNGLAENVAPIIVELAGKYTHILFPATTFGKNIAPRVAALLDTQQISDITKVINDKTFERPVYAGNALAVVESSDDKKVITVRGIAFDKVGETGSAPVEDVSTGSDTGLSSFKSAELSKSERPELTAANIVISGGRGMGSGENFALIEKLADKLGAAIGASRAAVDAGYVPNDYQVGQTGKIVAPNLYIAVGISGAIQHLAGMKDSKVIVAINKDPEAPIFQVADYGLVGDLFEILPELEKKL
jgi:electron transfer flavoprotein alpha subunit